MRRTFPTLCLPPVRSGRTIASAGHKVARQLFALVLSFFTVAFLIDLSLISAESRTKPPVKAPNGEGALGPSNASSVLNTKIAGQDSSSRKLEEMLESARQDIDSLNWAALQNRSDQLSKVYARLPENIKAQRALELIKLSQIVVDAGHALEAMVLLTSVNNSAKSLSPKMEVGVDLMDVAEKLALIGAVKPARQTADAAWRLVSEANTWHSQIESQKLRYEKINTIIDQWARGSRSAAERPEASATAVVTSSKGYQFNYAVLGGQSVVLLGNTRVCTGERRSAAENDVAFAGCYGNLGPNRGRVECTTVKSSGMQQVIGRLDQALPASMKFSWTLESDRAVARAGDILVSKYGSIPPRPMSYPFPIAPSPTAKARDLGDLADRGLKLEPGDYTFSRVWTRGIELLQPARTRIFILGDHLTAGPCFWLQSGGEAGGRRGAWRQQPAVNLEIWYNGCGTIKIDHNCQFRGIIYAPNARILLGPNNVDFRGAIVGRDIVADGNVTIEYDESLLQWQP